MNRVESQLAQAHAMFEACEGIGPSASVPTANAPRTSLRRKLSEYETDNDVNYGSEDDSASDGDEEEPMCPAFIPRAQRELYFSDEDELPEPAPEPPQPSRETRAYGPTDLFQYDWVELPSPAGPTVRRETFRGGEVGPTAVFPTPYDAFTAIWTPQFMQRIVEETNRYAQQTTEQKFRDGTLGPQSRVTQWRDTDVDELYVFFALLLATGACVKSCEKEYWSKDEVTSTPGFGQFMSCNRYQLLNSCLHFVDNETDIRSFSRSRARVFKIEPVIQHLNDRFQVLYTPDRNIAIDESLTQWKGWLAFKQYMKTKAAGVGIKTFELCESRTGYLWRFKVYTGRDMTSEDRPLEYTVTLVLKLLRGLEDKGYTVWMDNWYNSPALARLLKCSGFDCAGTLRTNRRGVPPHIKNLANTMARGQVSGWTSGDVDVLLWRDVRCVSMISTYHGAGVHTTSRGKTKPTVVHEYNVCMGGVDKKDQMLSAYPIERKRTRIWYKKLFRRLLNVSVLNAFILHRERAHIRKHRVFRKVLVSQLLEKHNSNRVPLEQLHVQHTPRAVLSRQALQHFPRQYGFKHNSTRKERIRHRCVVCHKRQYTYCPACKVALCMDECIIKYHSPTASELLNAT